MTPHGSAATAARPRLDLRAGAFPEVLAEVERGFGVRLDAATAVVKRRSIGMATDRGTWVRVEARAVEKLFGQSVDGVEAAAPVAGVCKPAWFRGVSWIDHDRGVMWRADETERISAAPISTGGILTHDPQLPATWWHDLTRSLTALAAYQVNRVATVHTTPITQARITTTITAVTGDVADTTITAWGAVHADLAWTNLTSPELTILDWEDFGHGPVGLDHASLWAASLAVPGLVERIETECAAVLATRTGQLCQLFALSELLSAPPAYAGPLRAPAEAAAADLISALR